MGRNPEAFKDGRAKRAQRRHVLSLAGAAASSAMEVDTVVGKTMPLERLQTELRSIAEANGFGTESLRLNTDNFRSNDALVFENPTNGKFRTLRRRISFKTFRNLLKMRKSLRSA